jgi:hypothetical protein
MNIFFGATRVLMLCCAFLLAGECLATSSPTATSAAADDRPAQSEPGQKQHIGIDQPTLPASSVVNKNIYPQSQADEKQEKQAHGEWGNKSEIALAVITLFLAIFTGCLWCETFKLAKRAKIDGDRQANETKEQLKIAAQSFEATQKSVALAREEFVATHRPKLIVRRIALTVADESVNFQICNVGDSEAIITAISTRLWSPEKAENLPAVPKYTDPGLGKIAIKSGESKQRNYIIDVSMLPMLNAEISLFSTLTEEYSNSQPTLFFLGYIDYVDINDVKRQTAFLRQYDFKVQRFNALLHPDYEYVD